MGQQAERRPAGVHLRRRWTRRPPCQLAAVLVNWTRVVSCGATPVAFRAGARFATNAELWVKLFVVLLNDQSHAPQVTVLVPIGNVDPEAGSHEAKLLLTRSADITANWTTAPMKAILKPPSGLGYPNG
jgi:hypothetical protein